jgi:hypothetical protein
MFDIIYNFISQNLTNTTIPSAVSSNSSLTLILSSITIILIYSFLVWVVVWAFKFITGLLK